MVSCEPLWIACVLCWMAFAVMVHPACAAETNTATAPASQSAIRIVSLLPDEPVSRARRPAPVAAVIENTGAAAVTVKVSLHVPAGVKVLDAGANQTATIQDKSQAKLVWKIEAEEATHYDLRVEVSAGAATVATASYTMGFLPAVEMRKLPYIPDPQPVKTSILIGAHDCPLWEADKPEMWANLLKHPERTPVLGFYDQTNPEVADWETKWAVEHGVSFFIYCWYRASEGGPVTMNFGSAIEARLKSRFANDMKFTIMWENQRRGVAGVADEHDLMANLLPFWINHYFKQPSYLKIDNKPVLFIYRPEFLVQDLGSVENVRSAFGKMRQACKDAGFDGLYILGEYRGLDPKHLELMKSLGLDYTFAYCWYVPNNPTPQQSIDAQMKDIHKTRELGILPQVVTVSQAWSGWHDEGTIWKIPPHDYETLLRDAKQFISALPHNELGSKMLLLDNWNEWGEGHYIAPYREYGFGYLDAVRKVFSDAPEKHVDLIPPDIGMGPYDTAYKKWEQQDEAVRKLASKRVLKAGATEKGLVAWWSFDEPKGTAAAFDYSGNRLGGGVLNAKRAPGIDGSALVCDGGCVVVPSNPLLSITGALTIECWVKTDTAGQKNTWMVNRVFGGGTTTGYRLGVVDGKPCFEIPVTSFSHHLMADIDLPTGRWVHLAGTFDGKVMRIYVDGQEHGTLDRPGPIKPNNFHLCLGNYEIGHSAHFIGLLDEVKLYDRALSPEEIREHYLKFADKAGAK